MIFKTFPPTFPIGLLQRTFPSWKVHWIWRLFKLLFNVKGFLAAILKEMNENKSLCWGQTIEMTVIQSHYLGFFQYVFPRITEFLLSVPKAVRPLPTQHWKLCNCSQVKTARGDQGSRGFSAQQRQLKGLRHSCGVWAQQCKRTEGAPWKRTTFPPRSVGLTGSAQSLLKWARAENFLLMAGFVL